MMSPRRTRNHAVNYGQSAWLKTPLPMYEARTAATVRLRHSMRIWYAGRAAARLAPSNRRETRAAAVLPRPSLLLKRPPCTLQWGQAPKPPKLRCAQRTGL